MEDSKKVIQGGALLGYPANYWEQFIKKDGSLDKEKLVKNGYDGPEQADWIEGEMVKLGWIEKADEGKKGTGTKKGK